MGYFCTGHFWTFAFLDFPERTYPPKVVLIQVSSSIIGFLFSLSLPIPIFAENLNCKPEVNGFFRSSGSYSLGFSIQRDLHFKLNLEKN